MFVDHLSTMPGVLVQDFPNDIRSLILNSRFDLSCQFTFSKSLESLTISIGKTAKAPIAPAIPPLVKFQADSPTSCSQLRGAAGTAEEEVGSGGDHYPSAPCQPIAKPTLASSSASKSAIPNLCTVSWAPLLAR